MKQVKISLFIIFIIFLTFSESLIACEDDQTVKDKQSDNKPKEKSDPQQADEEKIEAQVEKLYERNKEQILKKINEVAVTNGLKGKALERFKKQTEKQVKDTIRAQLVSKEDAEEDNSNDTEYEDKAPSDENKETDDEEITEVKSRLFLKANEVLEKLIGIRGLKKKRDVEISPMTRNELYDYLSGEFDKDIIDSDNKMDDLINARLGFQPEGVDTKEVMLKMLKQGVAGFYDPKTKKYYLIQKKNSTKFNEATIAHELVHALQDQYYDLMKLPVEIHGNSDVGAALKCVIEGDAKFAELAYMKKYLGKNEDKEWLESDIGGQGIYMAKKPGGMYIDYKKAGMSKEQFFGMFIGKILMYPYFEGARFVNAVHKKGGWDAVNHLYEDWPLSTEQIIHPEKFLDPAKRDDPTEIDAKDFIDWLDNKYDYVNSDVIGERGIDLLLINFLPRNVVDAEVAGAGWEGDRFVGFVNNENNQPSYVWMSLWETEKDAQEFAEAMTKFYQKRFGKPSDEKKVPDTVVAAKDNIVSWVERQGKKVIICDGESLEASKTLLKQALNKSKIKETISSSFWSVEKEVAK